VHRRKSDRYEVSRKTKGYTISILGTCHEDVSSRLARQGEHKLHGVELRPTMLDRRRSPTHLAVFECSRDAIHEVAITRFLIDAYCGFTAMTPARRSVLQG